jgi:O-antigen/teichoic acid export membrane protein
MFAARLHDQNCLNCASVKFLGGIHILESPDRTLREYNLNKNLEKKTRIKNSTFFGAFCATIVILGLLILSQTFLPEFFIIPLATILIFLAPLFLNFPFIRFLFVGEDSLKVLAFASILRIVLQIFFMKKISELGNKSKKCP